MTTAASASEASPLVKESKLAPHAPSWHQHIAVLMPTLTIYFALAFYHIDHQSLWLDEVLSLLRADPEGAFLAPERWSPGHGPLYFRMLHLWARWGTSEFMLRALSTIFGAITVCLSYLMGLRLRGQRMAWIGATLLASSPFLIWYSQEVRYVMLMMAAALLAMYAFHRALFAKRPIWWLLHCWQPHLGDRCLRGERLLAHCSGAVPSVVTLAPFDVEALANVPTGGARPVRLVGQ